MPIECLTLLADDLPEPLTDDRTIDVVVVCPTLVARIIWWVDVDALDLPGVIREQRFERNEVMPCTMRFPSPGSPQARSGTSLSRRNGTWW